MKILILEDELYFQQLIVKLAKETIKNFEYIAYSNLSDCLKDTNSYDLAILDIKLEDGDGIEYAKTHSDKFNQILFLTSMENRVYDAFGKNVVGFILKERIGKALPLKLKEIISTLYNTRIHFRTDLGVISLDFKDIIYVETEARNIRIIADKTYVIKRTSLSKFAKQLDIRFVWISQSMLINLDYVNSWKKDEIILSNKYTVYASRRHLKDAFHAFMERK